MVQRALSLSMGTFTCISHALLAVKGSTKSAQDHLLAQILLVRDLLVDTCRLIGQNYRENRKSREKIVPFFNPLTAKCLRKNAIFNCYTVHVNKFFWPP